MKTIVPKKIILEVNDEGTMGSAVLLYNINDNGNIVKGRSVRVTLNAEEVNPIIADAIASANTSEGL